MQADESPRDVRAGSMAELQHFLEESEGRLSEAEKRHGHAVGLSPDGRHLFYGVVPAFLVDDIVETCDYYARVLGFSVNFTYGEPAIFACVSRNQTMINFNLSQPPGCRNSARAAGALDGACDAYVLVTHIDELFEELRRNGATIVSEPVGRDYGMREGVIEDCNGYRLTLADRVIGG